MKSISENKLKAFSIGRMNVTKNTLSKKEKEELRKKEEEMKTAEVYNDFVASFEGEKSHGKTFVRGDVINPDEKTGAKRGKLYKPASKLQELVKSFSVKPESPSTSTPPPKIGHRPVIKKKDDKKKSNLELFKEELKIIQAEREQRHALKKERNSGYPSRQDYDKPEPRPKARSSRFDLPESPPRSRDATSALSTLDELVPGSHDSGDPMTTNLFLGNVNPNMDEQMLCAAFGKYGPLASVKIMWPRTEEERSRERNCAFVAFMTRKSAEKAMKNLQGQMVMEYEMKLGWGKSVPIPPHPIYVPPVMLERTMPPPPSGLPFNAQPKDTSKSSGEMGVLPHFRDEQEFEETVANSVVRVVVPTERNLLVIIHRMIEFVVREGPMFEAMIMNREINNPMFRFLFDNQSPAHIYYRWRMFSILMGENHTKWRTQDFRLFKGGSWWRPPPLNPYEEVLSDNETDKDFTKPKTETEVMETKMKRPDLKDEDRDKLEEILRALLPSRQAIAEAMIFCLNHADAAEEIVECISESLSILQTPLTKKVARLYLVSDILYNCSAKVTNASFFRKHFEAKLEDIMTDLHKCHASIQGRLKAEQFKQRVMHCFQAWEDWAVYHGQFLILLQNTFLGLQKAKQHVSEKSLSPVQVKSEDVDGVALFNLGLPDEDVDGAPIPEERDEDLDGLPIEAAEDVDGIPIDKATRTAQDSTVAPRFVQSKWETVDPQEVEAQAMTTSKWEQLENKDDVDGVPLEDSWNGGREDRTSLLRLDSKLEEEKRAKLRDIEVKVMKFQDDLESGRRERNPDCSLSEQVAKYRAKLVERMKEKLSEMQERRSKDRKDKRKLNRTRSGSDGSSDSGELSPSRKKKKRKNKDSVATPRRSLVSYDSEGSIDSPRYSARRRKSPKRRSRSRSRERQRRDLGSDSRRRSRSPKRSRRSRSREDRLKKKHRSSRH